jgi:hypothetical protein
MYLPSAARTAKESANRASDGAGTRCTSPERTDHKTETRRVHYRWHPLYGRDVAVHGTKTRGTRSVVRCQEDTDDTRDRREVSAWMFDPVRCEKMNLCAEPYVSWAALCDLRDLLLACMTPCPESVDPPPSSPMEGSNGESTLTAESEVASGGALRVGFRPPNLVGRSERSAADCDRSVGPDAAERTGVEDDASSRGCRR